MTITATSTEYQAFTTEPQTIILLFFLCIIFVFIIGFFINIFYDLR